ncbi:MAG: hypothetical protein AB7Y74_14090 [Syntrophorhabdus sp.]|jgi:hypothetical protein
MKKLLLGIAILVFVAFASSVMAAAPKVPKNLCLDFDTYSDYQILLLKSVGNLPTLDGNLKMYTVTGFVSTPIDAPVQGSAYVLPSGTTLHATYNGHMGASQNSPISYELFFDLATKTGTIYYHYEAADGASAIHGTDTLTAADCKTRSMPSGVAVGGTENAKVGSFISAAH